MNDVPAIFFEGVVSQFTRRGALSTGRDLSGLLGHVVSQAYAKWCILGMFLRNGRLVKESYFNCEHERVEIETPNRKHLHYMQMAICADEQEYCTDPEATQRILNVTKGKHVLLFLHTANISEEIVKCVESIRLVFELQLHTKITSDVLKMMRSLVEKSTLNKILIAKDVKIEDETAQLLVDLLKQKQFHRMFLPEKCSAALKEIIASWRENSEEMVGKMVYCKEEFSELQFSSTEFAFEECTKEEERDAERAYFIPSYWPRITTKLVLRNQNGRAVYCFSRSSSTLKSVFVFA